MRRIDFVLFIIGITLVSAGGVLATWNLTAQLLHNGIYIVPCSLLVSNLLFSRVQKKAKILNRFIDFTLNLAIVANTFAFFLSTIPLIVEVMKKHNTLAMMIGLVMVLFLLFRINQQFTVQGTHSDPITS
jgi:hypothetical protein